MVGEVGEAEMSCSCGWWHSKDRWCAYFTCAGEISYSTRFFASVVPFSYAPRQRDYIIHFKPPVIPGCQNLLKGFQCQQAAFFHDPMKAPTGLSGILWPFAAAWVEGARQEGTSTNVEPVDVMLLSWLPIGSEPHM